MEVRRRRPLWPGEAAFQADWELSELLTEMRADPQWSHVTLEDVRTAAQQARTRRRDGAEAVHMLATNVGGIGGTAALDAERRAATASRPELDDDAAGDITRQETAKLLEVVRTTRLGRRSLVILAETRLRAGSEAARRVEDTLRARAEGWAVVPSHVPGAAGAGACAAGVLVWYDTTVYSLAGPPVELYPGRLLQMKLKVQADGTAITLIAAYMPPRQRAPTEAEQEALDAVWDALAAAVDAADRADELLLVAGDLNAETRDGLRRWSRQPTHSDDNLDQLEREFGLGSLAATEVTHLAWGQRGAQRSTIDHWLAQPTLAQRCTAMVVPGTGGRLLTTATSDTAMHGHNGTALRLSLNTAAAGVGAAKAAGVPQRPR